MALGVEVMLAASLAARLRNYFGHATTILLLAVLVACSLLLVGMRRRAARRQYRRPRPGPER